MSGPEEREARSVALERAYVHEVYEQISRTQACGSENKGRAWPRVKQFLSDLEPGSIVCDIGCGNGKYLNVNPSIFKIGADRCHTLADMAREKEHEVMLCDNLSLPFRDESFDAVLSIAVVHHFATTERRVGAIRELARVLRIGGKIIISVWAMEQRHRKFESQDVLVPWHRPQHLSAHGFTSTTTTSEDDGPPGYHQRTQTSDSGDSCRPGVCQRKRVRTRHKGRSIDPSRPYNSSPSSSSLSSPNETCYSFVRRALQKLAGGKRHHSNHHKPWFLESWSSCTKDTPPQRYDPEGCEDCENEYIQDLPIELRRLEEEQNHDVLQRRQTFTCNRQPTQYEVILNHKSKSLSDILTVGQRSMVRSRSSVPSLNVPLSETGESCSVRTSPTQSVTAVSSVSGSKPRLVKQKKSLCEEEEEDEDEEEVEVEERRDKATDMRDLVKALPDFKIHTFGGTRKSANVFKQSSMNEELMSAERLREKERVRQNIQKQASLNEELIFRRNRTLDSIKDTFFSTSTAKRFQLLKNGLTSKLKSSTTGIEKVAGTSFKNGFVRILQGWKGGEVSPTSRPETSPSEPVPPCTPPPENGRRCGSSSNSSSASDEKKDGTKPGERRHSREEGSDSSKDSSLQSDTSVDSEDSFASVIFVPKPDPPQDVTTINNNILSPPSNSNSNQTPSASSPPKSPQPLSPKLKTQPSVPPPKLRQSPPTLDIVSVVPPRRPSLETSVVKEPEPVKKDSLVPEKRHVDRLKKIHEILKSKTAPVTSRMSVPGFSTRSPFPLVRRCSTSATGVQEPIARPLPRLLSLELFNPETDDMDSDSSGVSSPDSVSSVISVLQEDPSVQKAKDEKPQLVVEDVDSTSLEHKAELLSPRSLSSPGSGGKTSASPENIPDNEHRSILEKEERVSPSISLLEAAADVASSLEETVDAVIQSSPRARRRQLQLLENNDTLSVLQDSYSSSSGSSSWSLHKSDSSSKASPVNPNKSFQKYDSGSDWSLISKGSRNSGVSPVTDPKNNNWNQGKSENTTSCLSPKNENDNSQNYSDIDTWDEDCRQHLVDFAEKLSQKLLDEIDQYRQQMCQQATLRSSAHSILESLPEGFQDDPYLSRLSEELHDLTRLSEELQERNSYLASLNNNSSNESLLYSGNTKPYSRRDSCCGTESSYPSPKTRSMESLDRDYSFHSYRRLEEDLSLAEETTLNEFVYGEKNKLDSSSRQTSEDVSEDFDKCCDDNISREGLILEQEYIKEKDSTHLVRKTGSGSMLRLGLSIESSDAGDISEQTASGSDSSRGDVRKDTDSAGKTPSTTSLGPESSDAGSEKAGSSSDCSKDIKFADRRMARCDGRSSSEEAPPKGMPLIRQKAAIQEPPEELLKTESCASSLSGSTSQESLPSDGGGGSITFHRYYHVFREGELDQLIEKYVDNLHIISSYYDHANWCIVAEKVQVWTI